MSRSVMWFGIDYYGEFYITKPGEYKFDLESDDGSRLEIDNQQFIDNDELHPAASKTARSISLRAGIRSTCRISRVRRRESRSS